MDIMIEQNELRGLDEAELDAVAGGTINDVINGWITSITYGLARRLQEAGRLS